MRFLYCVIVGAWTAIATLPEQFMKGFWAAKAYFMFKEIAKATAKESPF